LVTGEPLIRRPAHRGSITLARVVDRVGTLSAVFTGVGARADRDFSTFPATPVTMPPFATLDLGVELAMPALVSNGLRVQLRAENVTATRYREIAGFQSPGRSLYAGLKLQR
jgi:vitamin B12 transporter